MVMAMAVLASALLWYIASVSGKEKQRAIDLGDASKACQQLLANAPSDADKASCARISAIITARADEEKRNEIAAARSALEALSKPGASIHSTTVTADCDTLDKYHVATVKEQALCKQVRTEVNRDFVSRALAD
jgi:hypothetical protein